LREKGHLIFFPDRWLGTNSALALGIPEKQIALWDPDDPEGSFDGIADAQVVVWEGYCNVHVAFSVEHVRAIREAYPDVKIIVHPECRVEVVQAADAYGSTAGIIRYVEQARPGSTIAIGTEINLVGRLAQEHPGKRVVPLARSLCGAMYRTNPVNLRDALHSCAVGKPSHVVQVDAETTRWANLALERMLHP
jgi:quinolinate synthase